MQIKPARAADLFEQLQPEKEPSKRKEVQIANAGLRRIIENIEKVLEEIKQRGRENFPDYHKIKKLAPVGCRAADIEQFSVYLKKYEDDDDFRRMSGEYLSALINQGEDREVTLHTSHLEIKNVPKYMGYMNKGKYITVQGDVNDGAGEKMGDGKLVIHGNAGKLLGRKMSGGVIQVHGNLRERLWLPNPSAPPGIEMRGGQIYIFGDEPVRLPLSAKGGEIYHKGRLIMKDGRAVQ